MIDKKPTLPSSQGVDNSSCNLCSAELSDSNLCSGIFHNTPSTAQHRLDFSVLLEVLKEKRCQDKSSFSGSVFWHVLNNQYFPSDTTFSLDLPERMPSLRRLQGETVPLLISQTKEKLKRRAGQNLALWSELASQMASSPNRWEGLVPIKRPPPGILSEVKELGLSEIHDSYLQHLENQLKGHTESAALNSRKGHRGLREDDLICGVCGDGDYEDDDLIVICSRCDMGAHMKCYGVPKVPENDWFCDACVHYPNIEDRHKLRCVLCTVRGGALKMTNTAAWVHVFCVFRLERSCFNDTVFMTDIDLSKIPSERYGELCSICNSVEGACLKCIHCDVTFHPECAKDLFLSTRGSEDTGAYCLAHKPFNLRKVIELKDKKAADDIAAFCKLVEKVVERKKQRRGCTLQEKLRTFKLAEKEIRKIQKEATFEVDIKVLSFERLRSRVDVKRPEVKDVLEPQDFLNCGISLNGKSSNNLTKFYTKHVFPVMKKEVHLLNTNPSAFTPYKPKRRRVRRLPPDQRFNENGDIVSKELFCYCKQPEIIKAMPLPEETDEEFFSRVQKNKMIQCDLCDNWYHLQCVELPLDREIDEWTCSECSKLP